VRPDPPVRKDGRCSQCGQPRHPQRSRKYGQAAAELDPFCSSSCAKAWHGVPDRSAPALPNSRKVDPYITATGFCACGCGQATTIVAENNKARGLVKGQPRRYVTHHNLRPPA
jgi:hypothetical protein